MPEFIDPPASISLLNKLYEKTILKLCKGVNTTIIQFPGCGKTSEIFYLMRNLSKLPEYNTSHLFGYLDTSALLNSEEKAYRECLSFILNNFDPCLDYGNKELIHKLQNSKKIAVDTFSELIHVLTFEKNLSITFILGNFDAIFRNIELVDVLASVRRINPMKITFLFINSKELSENEISSLKSLGPYFVENIVWGREVLFDKESAKCLIKNQEKWKNHIFSETISSKIIALSAGDPMLLRELCTQLVTNLDIEEKITQTGEVSKIYELFGRDILDLRFKKILQALGKDSLECVGKNYQNPTNYLINTGLVTPQEGNKYAVPINSLFDYYVKSHQDYVKELIAITNTHVSEDEIDPETKKLLSAQELLVFKFLLSRKGLVVTREDVARILWGDTWEAQYSEQAIDKVISRIRAKLKGSWVKYEIKSLKGRGFFLE